MFTTTRSYHYSGKIYSLVDRNYNQSVHRRSNAHDVWKTLYEKDSKPIKYNFNLGDQVNISKGKRIFEKGYLPSWTEETFTIAQRLPRNPPVYRLTEADDDFYGQEPQEVIGKPDYLFGVQKVLNFQGKGANKEELVHWKGYRANRIRACLVSNW